MGNMYEIGAISPYRQPRESLLTQLTARQFEVLALLCEGLQNKQIARRLNIAAATVKIHVANILRALEVSSRLEAAVVALKLGLEPKSAHGQAQVTTPAPHRPVMLRLVTDPSDWPLEAAVG